MLIHKFHEFFEFPSSLWILPHQVPSWVFQFDSKQLKMAVPSILGHITQEIIAMKIRVFFSTHLDTAGDNYNNV
jgi:hypothetical protein